MNLIQTTGLKSCSVRKDLTEKKSLDKAVMDFANYTYSENFDQDVVLRESMKDLTPPTHLFQ